jgi:predicted nucleotidyltransferase
MGQPEYIGLMTWPSGLKKDNIKKTKMKRIRDISPEEKKSVQKILGAYLQQEEGILFAYLHGSFSGKGPFHDIDIAVFVEETRIPREKALDFELAASLRLEEKVRIPVDLKVINYAPLGFQYHSTAGTLLMCRNEDLRVDFLTKIRSLYFDFALGSKRFLLEMLHAE